MNFTLADLERTLALASRAATALLGGDDNARQPIEHYVEKALGLSAALAPNFPLELMEDLDLHLSGVQAAIEDNRMDVLLPCLSDARQASDELTNV